MSRLFPVARTTRTSVTNPLKSLEYEECLLETQQHFKAELSQVAKAIIEDLQCQSMIAGELGPNISQGYMDDSAFSNRNLKDLEEWLERLLKQCRKRPNRGEHTRLE